MNSSSDLYAEKILEAAFFENWLRFYFLQESPHGETISDEGKVYYKIPPEAIIQIKAESPQYLPMAEYLNGKPALHDTSIEAIKSVVPAPDDYATQVEEIKPEAEKLESGLEEIHTWLQISAKMLDCRAFSFLEWLELFNKWKKNK